MKKCPRCNSVSFDSENSCGVCGESLSEVTPKDLDSLVHNEPPTTPTLNRRLRIVGVTLITLGVALTGAGVTLLVLSNALGVFLIPAGLVLTLYIAGGPGIGIFGRRGGAQGKARMRQSSDRQIEEELKRRRGEED